MVHYWDEPSVRLNDHRRQLWSLLAAINNSYFCLELLNEADLTIVWLLFMTLFIWVN